MPIGRLHIAISQGLSGANRCDRTLIRAVSAAAAVRWIPGLGLCRMPTSASALDSSTPSPEFPSREQHVSSRSRLDRRRCQRWAHEVTYWDCTQHHARARQPTEIDLAMLSKLFRKSSSDSRPRFEQDSSLTEDLFRRVHAIEFQPKKGFLKDQQQPKRSAALRTWAQK